jgi:glycosyltransferase involved in cell wall biosynthesis
MIEPQCHGGICHYSHALCDALVDQGVQVTLLTGARSELQEWPRQFPIANVLDGSQVKALLRARVDRSALGSVLGARCSVKAAVHRPASDLPACRRRAASSEHRAPTWKARWFEEELFLFIRRLRADVVHFQWPVDWLDHGRFLQRLQRMGARTVFTAHDVLPHEPEPAHRRLYEGLYHSGSEIIVHSEQNRAELLEAFAPDPARVHVVPMGSFGLLAPGLNGPGQEPGARSQELLSNRERSRREYGLPPEARVALFFGLIRPYKGLDDLLRAFAGVVGQIQDAWLLVVGAPVGPEGEAQYRALIRALGIEGRTRFVPRYLPPEAVAQPFSAADFVVLPYRRASQSAVAQLAYALGKPVVATRVGGLPEVIEHGRSGYLVEAGDTTEIAAAVSALMADPDGCRTMGEYARLLSETRFAWSTIAGTTRRVYEGGVTQCPVS